ncbi:MAG: amidohydrolase family protein [Candidatus Rariloculaceae bacterium]
MRSRNYWQYELTLLVAWFFLPLHLHAQTTQSALVITGGTLIDGNGGRPLRDAVVVVEGNRITAVGEEGDVAYPGDAVVIDADGKFILPGLWDAMVSYQWFYGEIMLNHGITSTIDVGIAGEVGAAFRDGVLLGKIRAPRAFSGLSRLTSRPAGGTGLETILTPGRTPTSEEHTRELVRAFIAGGADIVMFQDGTLPLEFYRAGIDEAHLAGMPVSTRAYGPTFGPYEAAEYGSNMLPHSAGIGRLITSTPYESGDSRNEADLFCDMDMDKAEELIDVLVEAGVALDPTYRNSWLRYPADWERFAEDDRNFFDTADPNLIAYYPPARMEAALQQYRAPRPTGEVAERRIRGFRNSLRFHKMFVDAGGHLIPGSDSNPVKVPGTNLFHEMMIFAEGGVTPMQIIQGATKWSAEILEKDHELGTIEAGKIADIIIVNEDPLRDIENLRNLDSVIFDGRQVELGYSAGYNPVFRVESELNPPVSRVLWADAFRDVAYEGVGGRFNGRPPVGPGQPLPNPVESPQPALETISPVMVEAGAETTRVTLTGFHFVRRSQVLFKGVPVPHEVISGSEFLVTIDSTLLREPGWHPLVVKNPEPLHPELGMEWGDGTSNEAHLIVAFPNQISR